MANNYNPDVLNCIANLSNDEVFTPPTLANQVLDMLPQELFTSPKTTFLDPFTKSGVFLREIVKRLDHGLELQIPDRQQRITTSCTSRSSALRARNLQRIYRDVHSTAASIQMENIVSADLIIQKAM